MYIVVNENLEYIQTREDYQSTGYSDLASREEATRFNDFSRAFKACSRAVKQFGEDFAVLEDRGDTDDSIVTIVGYDLTSFGRA